MSDLPRSLPQWLTLRSGIGYTGREWERSQSQERRNGQGLVKHPVFDTLARTAVDSSVIRCSRMMLSIITVTRSRITASAFSIHWRRRGCQVSVVARCILDSLAGS